MFGSPRRKRRRRRRRCRCTGARVLSLRQSSVVQWVHGGRLVYITSRRHAQSTPSVSKGVANVPAQSSSPKVKQVCSFGKSLVSYPHWLCPQRSGKGSHTSTCSCNQHSVRPLGFVFVQVAGACPQPFSVFSNTRPAGMCNGTPCRV